MSQVIVTDDRLKKRRSASAEQERNIPTERMFDRWRSNDITKKDYLAGAIGLLALPVFVVWSGVLLLISAAVFFFKALMRALGMFLPSSRS